MTLLADVFPCEALLPNGGTVNRARAVITEDGVSVYVEEKPGDNPVLIFKSRLTAIPELPHAMAPRRRRRYDLATTDGRVLVNGIGGCMCNYPTLRTYTPERLHDEVSAGLIASIA